MQTQFKHALIVGASSGIGEALARQLAAAGAQVALVARREAELTRVAEAINGATAGEPGVTGRPAATIYPHDVLQVGEVPALFQRICRDLGGMDLVIYSSGIMPVPADGEYDTTSDVAVVQVNLVGAVAWLNEAASRFQRQGDGVIVGISSVAGERGRSRFPAYSASKAGLSIFLEGLRGRLRATNVKVVTVKPGPVDTPMTQGMGKMPLVISADSAARKILDGIDRGSENVYVPFAWRPIMFVVRCVPAFLYKRIRL